MSLNTEQLRELSQKIASNPDSVRDMSHEDMLEARKHLNPLGNIVTAKKCFANMSVINWRERWLRRLLTTSLIGYLYRLLEEYEPTDEIAKETRRFETTAKGVDAEQLELLKTEHESRLKLIRSTAKGIVKKFLDRNFEYNPDHHVRGSHSANKSDPERKSKCDGILEACASASSANAIDEKLASRGDITYKYMRQCMLYTYQTAVETAATVKAAIASVVDPGLDSGDVQGVLLRKYKALSDTVEDMRKVVEPLTNADTINAWRVNPPADAFHQFDRYVTNNYEQLREITTALYNEKPDLEFAVILHDTFKTAEQASNHRIQHEKEFRTDVFTIENSAVTLMGPFNENRQRVDVYNKNTEILKLMLEQVETDHKLGADLMKKRVVVEKTKNIELAGPDDPALAQYAKTMNTVQEYGAKKLLTHEDQQRLAAANAELKELRDDYEIPDDTIQVDMFIPATDADGNTTLTKSKFYSQAEAPLHLQENSQFVDKYQPVRAPGESLIDSYKTKVVTGKNGQKLEIKVPVKDNE